MTEAGVAADEIGYRIVLPPGWAQIPLRSGTDEAIEALLDAIAPDPPQPDTAERRNAAGAALRQAAAAVRDGVGVHLYVPVVARYGRPVAASFVVAEVAFGALEPVDPAAVVARRAAGAQADRLILDGTVCSRTRSSSPADPGRGVPVPSRRVEYLLPVPDDPDRWVLVTFSVALSQPADRDFSAELVKLFDAVMATFRWTRTPTV